MLVILINFIMLFLFMLFFHMGSASDTKYQLNDRVLCEYSGLYYEAKIIGVMDGAYSIHYQGWHKRHDEIVFFGQIERKFKQFSEEAHLKAKKEVEEAKLILSGKKKLKEGEGRKRNSTAHKIAPRSTPSVVNIPSTTKTSNSLKKKANVKVSATSFASPYPDVKKQRVCELPNELKEVLVDDHNAINGQQMLCQLPCKYTVEDIVKEYCAHLKQTPGDTSHLIIEIDNDECLSNNASALITSSHGIINYFDALLSFQLLYKFERVQFNHHEQAESGDRQEISATGTLHEAKKPSSLYGLPHLLRLLSKFDVYLKLVDWSDRMAEILGETVADFMKFLVQNRDKYFDYKRDYQSTTSDYKEQALL